MRRVRISSGGGWILGAALALLCCAANAHPGEQESIRRVLLDWANGVANANRAQVDALLSERFEHRSFFSPTEGRAGYPAAIATGEVPIQEIDLRHAQYAIEGERARVGDILGVVMQTARIAMAATLASSAGL